MAPTGLKETTAEEGSGKGATCTVRSSSRLFGKAQMSTEKVELVTKREKEKIAYKTDKLGPPCKQLDCEAK